MRLQAQLARCASLWAACLLIASSGIGSARPPAGEGAEPAISLIGGGTATSEWPTAALLATGVGQCSATLIGCRTALTSAHCVCNLAGTGAACPDGTNLLDVEDMVLFLQHAGFLFVESVEVPPSYAFGVGGDVALLHLAYPVRGIAPSPINLLTQPLAGEPGTIVGFGASAVGGADAGVKRVGSIEVASCADVPEANYVCWTFDGTQADTCMGDSGGPLFADVGAGMRLAGVHSGGDDICNVGDDAFDADVFVESLWILSGAGADLGVASCGDGSQIGASSVTTDGFTGTVATQATHSFGVPTGTKELRVALNAALGSSNDLDLYVKFGAPPTTSDFDCGPQLLGVFEFCTISDPAPGTWHVLVDVLEGGPAEYQVTVTNLPENPAPPSLATGDHVVTDFTAWEVMRVDGVSGDRSILSSLLRGSGPELAAPEGVSSGPGGKIVVANPLDRSLLQIDPNTGDRTVVSGCADPACSSQVGSGPAFLGPRFVAFGAAGATFVTDRSASGFNAVVQVDPATGNRSVVSGCENPSCSSVRGTGPALDTLLGITVEPGGDNDVLVASAYALLRIDPATGDRTVLSGCTDASCAATVGSGPSFGRPEEIERGAPGSLLVVDGDRDAPPFRAIFRVDLATGNRAIVSGCSDAACSGTIGTGPLFSAGLIGLGFAGSGDLLVSDGLQRSLFLVDPTSGDRSVFSGCVDATCTSVAGTGTQFTDPLGIVTIPEPDPRLALCACCALLAVFVRKRRGSRGCRAGLP